MPDAQTTKLLDANTSHNVSHADYLGRACGLAYQNAEHGREKFREELHLDAQLISIDNTQAWVGENDSSIVVAFRGSESFLTLDGFKDWLLTNARNFLVLPEGRIGTDFAAAGVGARFHRGFMEALAEIWDPLYKQIDAVYAREERPVWITGHSLGGALAQLCAWRLHQQFVRVHQIVTFGAPMIGNEVTAKAYQREFPNQIYRYVDAADIVPCLPTISLFSNTYNHCDKEIKVGESRLQTAAKLLGDVAEQAVEGTVTGAVTSAIADTIWTELRNGMPSHLMGNYLSQISERPG